MKIDGSFLPGEGKAERPEKRGRLAEAIEGKQVALLSFDDGPGPTGSPMLLLEFTDGSGLIVLAGRDRNSRYTARVLFRVMPAPKIWTPSRGLRWRFGHEAGALAEQRETDSALADLQRRVEGAVVEGVRESRTPAAHGGESATILFRGGGRLTLAAKVDERRRGADLWTADLLWDYEERQKSFLTAP